MPLILLGKAAYLKSGQCMANKVLEAVQHFENKYGEKTAACAIVAMIVYLVIAQ